jgi:hypothetical protein
VRLRPQRRQSRHRRHARRGSPRGSMRESESGDGIRRRSSLDRAAQRESERMAEIAAARAHYPAFQPEASVGSSALEESNSFLRNLRALFANQTPPGTGATPPNC